MDSKDIIELFDAFGKVEDGVRFSEIEEPNVEKIDTVFDKLNKIQGEMANKKIAEIESNLLQLEADLDLFLKDYVKS